jgi:hypothetical protein
MLHEEVLLVAASSLCMETEIAQRLRNAAADAVRRGEDFQYLDGGRAVEGEVTAQV